ncbi:hypothetical protein EAD89_00910 [Micromonospora sp. BL4]|nr:hypothetical protein EAD89_00910 [Micromonospora sp. BL4]
MRRGQSGVASASVSAPASTWSWVGRSRALRRQPARRRGGRAADRSLSRTLVTVLAVLGGFTLISAGLVPTIVALVLPGIRLPTVPPSQLRIMRYAQQAPTRRDGRSAGPDG